MPSVTKTIELELPQAEAFALATDPVRFEEWLTLHAGWPNGAPGSPSEGDEFRQQLKIMGMPAQVNWKVEELDEPSRLVMKGAGPMGATLTTSISAAGDGDATTLSYETEFSGGGLEGPMAEAVTKAAGDAVETSLEKLKTLA